MARGHITDVTTKGAETTYSLKVESGGKRSDHGCDCKRSRDDVQSGGGEGGGKRSDDSDHSCDCKGTRDDIHPGGGEQWQEVRSQL